jgi:tRNA modification GTPase
MAIPGVHSTETIFALSTASGRSAIAVIRVSGSYAAQALDRIAGKTPDHRQVLLRSLRHPVTDVPIDQALVLFFKGPASETGEDVAEFQVHGGHAVIAATLAALTALPGCRLATPGEFARRAFHNGKLDLTAAEGLIDLIDAETEAQRIQALAQASGGLAALYTQWRAQMLQAQALVEAAIDFSDENDVSTSAVADAQKLALHLRDRIVQHLGQANRGEILRSGYKVVLAGPPNVGKSSLLNALANRDAAIVSEEAGTTRDVVEVRLDLGGMPVIISDTAGIRPPAGTIEQEGIRRTLARAREADLVVWLVDALAPVPEPPPDLQADPSRVLVVYNKADAVSADRLPSGALGVSAQTGASLGQLAAVLASRATAEIKGAMGPAPTLPRHKQHLAAAAGHLNAFELGDRAQLELRAEDLRLAGMELGRLTGRIDPEDVLGEIFGRFCIGK